MINVVIVEDEDIIRNGLRYTFDWLKLDCVVVGSANNGEVGLKLIRELSPDIVLTDIKMPVKNGLDMVAEAVKEGHRFETIVLTSYSDFEYAKKSIELKVFDYLLKPISNAKLIDVVERAKIEIENVRGMTKYRQILEERDVALSESKLNFVSSKNQHVNYALKKIECAYSDKISIESISQEIDVSVSYLCRVFKQHTSQTFLDFLNKYRVQKAIELLKGSSHKVYEVAEMVGFSEYKRFYQVFKECTGISPTEFLKKIEGYLN